LGGGEDGIGRWQSIKEGQGIPGKKNKGANRERGDARIGRVGGVVKPLLGGEIQKGESVAALLATEMKKRRPKQSSKVSEEELYIIERHAVGSKKLSRSQQHGNY